MDRTERFYRIERLLTERSLVPVAVFLQELEVSLATFKRDLEYLRSRLNAPIVWDRDLRGYRFDKPGVGDAFELPGLWFSATEIHALLTMQELLESLGPGLLTPHVQPLLTRLKTLLDREDIPLEQVRQRIRVQRTAARRTEPQHFAPIATAVLKRSQLRVTHYHRARDETLVRVLSPQRLSYYRENWYLDAWCHVREGLRSFALDAIVAVSPEPAPAIEVPEAELHAVLDAGYGIFAGRSVAWAELRFARERARWVSLEVWHPAQRGRFDTDGRYVLTLPFSAPQELVMDVMRHLPEVEVLGPPSLRDAVRARVAQAWAQFDASAA